MSDLTRVGLHIAFEQTFDTNIAKYTKQTEISRLSSCFLQTSSNRPGFKEKMRA